MYSTCLHCHAALGTNDVIEGLPIGRVLAFDPARGRLWVVCKGCRRWNLTPIEERWEPVEQCEKAFRDTRLRASTDNIGMARLSEGLEVIRIGKALAPEIAVWRYAGSFRKRWITRGLPAGVAAALVGLLPQLMIQTSAHAAPMLAAFGIVVTASIVRSRMRTTARIPLPDGTVQRLLPAQVVNTQLMRTSSGWGINPAHGWALIGHSPLLEAPLRGPAATHALRGLMTVRNGNGALGADLDDAVALLARAPSADAFISGVAKSYHRGAIGDQPTEVSLALEMALHADSERRAMEGELAALEEEWALAEEIANISDNLLLPASVQTRLSGDA